MPPQPHSDVTVAKVDMAVCLTVGIIVTDTLIIFKLNKSGKASPWQQRQAAHFDGCVLLLVAYYQ